jgi:3-methyl-2-oxobutanoate hydroxymethyltransferase
VNIFDFNVMKSKHEKITMVTCYDYTSACMLAKSTVDCLLVGDSVAMVMHGFQDTLSATVEMICTHTEAVSRGAKNKFIVSDLPFMSYRKSLTASMSTVEAIVKAGANAVKLEGAVGNLRLIKHVVESGVPVMGHLGLTPQFIHSLGGYKVQGKTEASAKRLLDDALALQEAGCFALVLECVPRQVAKTITQQLVIPTIGIGAGSDTDGQVLVLQDLLGLNVDFSPKFVKTFVDGNHYFASGIEAFVKSTKLSEFPADEHCFEN